MSDTKDVNTQFWELWKTDPSHTKKFQRAGGFKGTAIKPIYTEYKMTEVFGPAGQGWGMGEPKFETVQGSEDQVAVFCTVALWWRTPPPEPIVVNQEFAKGLGPIAAGPLQYAPNASSTGINTVYGVGGDMVVVKQSAGLRTDDEAFKKAFTDAVGNAMKHLGMSADVHMGLFDDSKYVREREEEAKNASQSHTDEATGHALPVTDTIAKLCFPALQDDFRGCATRAQLDGAAGRWQPAIAGWSVLMQDNATQIYDEMAAYLAEHDNDARAANADIIEADLRAAMSMDDLKAKWSGWGDAMRKLGKDDVVKLSTAKEDVKRVLLKIGKMPDLDNLDTRPTP